MAMTDIEAITLRTYINDAGIRSTWLVGEWPARVEFSNDLLRLAGAGDLLHGVGQVTVTDTHVDIDLLNAAARYRIDSRDSFRDTTIATLERGRAAAEVEESR